jgi:outer membrane protein assembly factor BamB
MRAGPCAAAAGTLALAAALWVAAALGVPAGAGAAAPWFAPAGSGSWTVYHQNPAGTGVAPSVTAVSTGTRAWTSPTLDGDIYGEPLVFAKRVYVATQNDTVYALSSGTGRLAWSRHLGRPVPAGSLPCGNIAPTVGIIGTPVIDPSRREIFVVAAELVHGRPAHVLAGLDAATGRIEMTQNVDPAGADPASLLQRTGLTLDAGRVVFGMGGNYGDCGSYRGRVEAAPETGGKPAVFTVDAAAGESRGAVWMGGAAPVVDRNGHVWVSVGNGSVTSSSRAYDHSDSVLELSPAMRLLQFFAPRTWATDNSQDHDMSSAPVLLSDGQVIAAGKSRIVYLLDGAHLGGIGQQQAALGSACSDDIDGGSAVAGTTVYLPCLTGVIAVQAAKSPAALRLMWSSGTGGGPPIIAAGLVWTIGQNGTLYGLDPATGRVRQQASIGASANHFPTPSVGGGLLLAPSARHVVAFRASRSRAATPATLVSTPATASVSPQSGQSTPDGGGGVSPGAIAGSVLGGLGVVGAGGWLLWRRRAADDN